MSKKRKLTRVYPKNNLTEVDKEVAKKKYDELGLKDKISLEAFQEIDFAIRQIIQGKAVLKPVYRGNPEYDIYSKKG